MSTVGIIASPAAGKDVRRLVANAGSVGDVDKIALIRRAAVGAAEGGATRLLVLDDARHLVLRALDGFDDAKVEMLDLEPMGSGRDSVRGAEAMAQADVGAVLVFGGDGTNRDVARGWADAVVMPVAVGTNNVFPQHIETTLAGLAAGLVASGAVSRDQASSRCKVIHVQIDDLTPDQALVDLVLVDGDFIGSRAVWHTEDLRHAVFSIAEPGSVGLSAIGSVLQAVGRDEAGGLEVRFSHDHEGQGVRAAVSPGTFENIGIAAFSRLDDDQVITVDGPGVLAFDGERDHVLGPKDSATVTIRRDGPWVINPQAAIDIATSNQFFSIGG